MTAVASPARERLAGLSRQEKLALLERLARERSRRPKSAPLSFAQERLFFLDRLDPRSFAHTIFRAFELRGDLDNAALAAALGAVVWRHEALRTTFATADGETCDGETRQVIAPPAAAQSYILPLADLAGLPGADEEAERQARRNARQPFELSRGPLLRSLLLRLGPHHHVLCLALHHIVADGWSAALLARELGTFYRAFRRRRPASLPALPIQYSDFARWQRHELDLASQLEFWRRALAGAPHTLEVPGDRPRPSLASLRGHAFCFVMPEELGHRAAELGRAQGATLFMTLFAAFATLLYRYTGQGDVLIGTPIANRHRPELEGLIGCFANTVVLRAELDDHTPFREMLARLRGHALGAYAHQDLPFERLVEELEPRRDLARNPLFQVMFALQNMPAAAFELEGLELVPLSLDRGLAKVDLTLDMIVLEQGLAGFFEYASDLFDETTVRRMAGHFERLLGGIAAAPDRPVAALPLLSAAEEVELRREWNDSAAPLPLARTLPELLAERAAATPDALAVDAGTTAAALSSPLPARLSYSELARAASRLAMELRRRGVGPEVRVAVCCERSPEVLVAFWAVLEAGGAYVPLDPKYPAERLAFLLDDSGAILLLTQERLLPRLPEHPLPQLLLDRDFGHHDPSAGAPPFVGNHPRPENAAYVIYTSGSTGRPKGVVVPYRALVNHALAVLRRYDLRPGDRVLQFASLSFDIAAEELYPTWLAGATVVPRGVESLEFNAFRRLLEAAGITVANLPTPYWQELVSELAAGHFSLSAALRLIVVGTEQALPERVETWRRAVGGRPRWINAYGPSEATITATVWEPATARPVRHVPIGRPIANVRAHVLDRDLRLLPAGAPGELYLGGPGLARGYLGRPRLSALSFLPDPFAETPGERLYRTGDRARRLADGNIELHGRLDDQVKIRGFRIEPGEIEDVLGRHPLVKEAVVLARRRAADEPRLVAYAVPEVDHRRTELGAAELRAFVAAALPSYMVPAACVILDALPLTPSGKIDRRALPEPGWNVEPAKDAEGDAVSSAPRGPLEELVASVFAVVLDLPRVGRDDDFFARGGHSLLATRVLARLGRAVGRELPLRALFEAPSPAALAGWIERHQRAARGFEPPPLTPRPDPSTPPPLSFAQRRLWFLEQLEPGTAAYNMPAALDWRGELEPAALQCALCEIVRRHESLRTTFHSERGEPFLRVADPRSRASSASLLPLVDLGALPDPSPLADRLARQESRRPFDLGRGPMLRTVLLRLDASRHRLLFTFHHIVSDGWSTDVFLRELAILYEGFAARQSSMLPDLPLQYGDFAAWQHAWLRGSVLERQLAWWRRQLENAPAVLELPADRPRPAVPSYRGGRVPVRLPSTLGDQLTALSRRAGTTLFMTFLAAFATLLERHAGQGDAVIGTPVAGRRQLELEGLIGFFVNTLALRLCLADRPTFSTLLERARAAVLGADAHQDLPFEQLVEELQPARDLHHHPFFQVFFVLHHPARLPAPGGERRWTLPSVDNRTARFDLTLSLVELAGGFGGFLEYSDDLFDRCTATRLAGQLRRLLEAAVAAPEMPFDRLPLLSDAERHRAIHESSDARAAIPEGPTVAHLVAARAARQPGATALQMGEMTVTYGELERRVGRLAARLGALGVGPETVVAVALERGPRLVTALLAIPRAGGAYLPLDPIYPAARLAYMLEDSRAAWLITEDAVRDSLPKLPQPDAIDQANELEFVRLGPSTPTTGTARLDNLAYVIYTSGSTGRPKGVQITHRNLLNFLASMAHEPGLDSEDALLAVTTVSFDIATLELFLPLVRGARVVIADRAEAADGESLATWLEAAGISVMQATPVTWRLLLSSGWKGCLDGRRGLRVLCGGEALPAELAAELERRAGEAWNLYGPTETTVWSAVKRIGSASRSITATDDAVIPLGRPVANNTLRVLDRHLMPLPLGVAGELRIGGDALARGYRDRPALTAERFAPDLWSGEPGARLYHSGDLARHRADGELEFLGRLDHQVKVRGFRIELGEIEAALERHPAVDQAVVTAQCQAGGDDRLIAWLKVQSEVPADEEWRAFLRAALPDYMVPAAFAVLEEFPLTPNRKVDRGALGRRQPPDAAPAPRRGRAARTELEVELAEIWCEVLHRAEIGIDEHFFDLGGHSLLATQVMARINERCAADLPLRTLFEHPTIAALAAEIEKRTVGQADPELVARLLAEIGGLE